MYYLVIVAVLVVILLGYAGIGRDWWPRDPFVN